jgi:hypothetical protein
VHPIPGLQKLLLTTLAFFGEQARAPPHHSGEITTVTSPEKKENAKIETF